MKELQLLHFKKIINNENYIKKLLDVIDKQKIYIEKLQ